MSINLIFQNALIYVSAELACIQHNRYLRIVILVQPIPRNLRLLFFEPRKTGS